MGEIKKLKSSKAGLAWHFHVTALASPAVNGARVEISVEPGSRVHFRPPEYGAPVPLVQAMILLLL